MPCCQPKVRHRGQVILILALASWVLVLSALSALAAPTPRAHAEFCARYVSLCMVRAGKVGTLRELRDVNRRVNDGIIGDAAIETLQAMRGRDEPWTVWPKFGVCHDYAVTKQAELIKRGWPSSSLMLAIVLDLSNAGHMILLVDTGAEILALDNLTDEIKPPAATRYVFVKVQSPDDPLTWVTPDVRTGRVK